MEILDFTGTRYLERADSRPTFGGTAASEIGKTGSVALIQFGGQNYTVNIGLDGKFSWTSPVDVADGEYSLSIIIQDRAGNQSSPILRTAIIDTTPPEAPTLLKLTDNVGDIQGSFDESKPTDDKTPTLTGIAQKGATVFLKNEAGSVIGSAVADKESGVWVITPVTELSDGINNLTLSTQELFAGETRVSAESPLVITVAPDGSSGPGDVTITDALDDAGSYKGPLASGATTDDTTPTLRGTVTAGQDVTVQYRLAGSSEWMTGVPAINGTSWSWTAPDALAEGKWEFRALTDGSSTGLFVLDITSTPQNAVTITHAVDNAGAFAGELASGTITDDVTPELHGRAESNSIVYLFYRTAGSTSWTALGSAQVGTDGSWSAEVDRVPTGNIEFRATASNDASASGDNFGLTIIEAGSNVPVISGAWDDAGYVKGVIIGGYTDDTTPTLKGKAEANSKVIVEYSNGAETYSATVQVGRNGQWEFTPPDLALGSWTFKAKTGDEGKWGTEYYLSITDGEFYNKYENFDAINRDSSVSGQAGVQKYIFDSGLTLTKLTGGIVIDYKSIRTSPDTTLSFDLKGSNSVEFQLLKQDSIYSSDVIVDIYDIRGHLIHSSILLSEKSNEKTFNYSSPDVIIGKINITSTQSEIKVSNFKWQSLDIIKDNHIDFAGHALQGSSGFHSKELRIGDKATIYLTDPGEIGRPHSATPDAAKHAMGEQAILISANTEVNIDFRGATNFSYQIYSQVKTDINIKIYDLDNKVISSQVISADSAKTVTPFNFTTNNGELIGLVTFSSNKSFYFDNLNWSTPSDALRPVEKIYEFDDLPTQKLATLSYNDITFEASNSGLITTTQAVGTSLSSDSSLGFSSGDMYTVTLSKFAKQISLDSFDLKNNSTITFYNTNGESIGEYISSKTLGNNFSLKYKHVRFDAPEGESISYFVIDAKSAFNLDHLRIRYTDEQPDYVKPFSVEDDSLHQLAQVEDLASVALLGSEEQTDTLQLTGKNQVLDLSAHQDRIESMEIVDLTGKGDNTLKIDLSSLLAYGEQDLFIQDGKTQLMVKGDAGDVVQLKDILPEGSDLSEWQHQDGTVTVAGVEYQVYSHGDDAELLVQQGVKTELI